MSTTTEPTITHPAWCAPSQCVEECHRGTLVSVYHWSMANVWASAPNSDHDADLTYIRVDDAVDAADSEPTTAFLKFHGSDTPLTADQVESLGLWLATEATVMRRQIAGESGEAVSESTVLDDELDLAVRSTDTGSVVLHAPTVDDGEWWFSAADARALAAALLDHAARAEDAEDDGR